MSKLPPISEKQCTKCKKIKSISQFTKNCQKKDGYLGNCRDCKGHKNNEIPKTPQDAVLISSCIDFKDFYGYAVSTSGDIYTCRNWGDNNYLNEWVKMSDTIKSTGYREVVIKRKTIRVHKIVAKLFIANPYNKPYINHINGIKTDNRVDNLEWCTASENTIHAYINGLMPKTRKRNKKPILLASPDVDTNNQNTSV